MTLKSFIAFSAAASLLLLGTAEGSDAKIRLPEQLGDHCVLQQQTAANLWGEALPGGKVTVRVSWSKEKYTTLAGDDGKWILKVNTPKGSYEPQTITVSDKDGSVTLGDVLIGEVWLAGGQSNMEMPLGGFRCCPIEGAAETILAAGEYRDKVREVKIPKTGTTSPEEYVEGRWDETTPETARRFTAVGWHFAAALNGVLDVPVGILACNWGGSAVESWVPKEVVYSYPENTIPSGRHEPFFDEGGWYNCTSNYVMYNGMLHPLRNYTIRGFIWYQGETNAGVYPYYAERLGEMVRIWRELWGQGELPFYQVELAPYIYGGDGTTGARIREAQRTAAKTIPGCGIVCTNDLAYPYEYDQIHPCQKRQVGQRLALLALNRTYGMASLPYEGPVFEGMEINGSEVKLSFKNAGWDGMSPWHDLVGFELAGEDRVFHPAEGEVRGINVYLHSSEVSAPVAVRYCFRDFQVGNLTGSLNLPAAPFRTDEW